jgi:hypothetical protein
MAKHLAEKESKAKKSPNRINRRKPSYMAASNAAGTNAKKSIEDFDDDRPSSQAEVRVVEVESWTNHVPARLYGAQKKKKDDILAAEAKRKAGAAAAARALLGAPDPHGPSLSSQSSSPSMIGTTATSVATTAPATTTNTTMFREVTDSSSMPPAIIDSRVAPLMIVNDDPMDDAPLTANLEAQLRAKAVTSGGTSWKWALPTDPPLVGATDTTITPTTGSSANIPSTKPPSSSSSSGGSSLSSTRGHQRSPNRSPNRSGGSSPRRFRHHAHSPRVPLTHHHASPSQRYTSIPLSAPIPIASVSPVPRPSPPRTYFGHTVAAAAEQLHRLAAPTDAITTTSLLASSSAALASVAEAQPLIGHDNPNGNHTVARHRSEQRQKHRMLVATKRTTALKQIGIPMRRIPPGHERDAIDDDDIIRQHHEHRAPTHRLPPNKMVLRPPHQYHHNDDRSPSPDRDSYFPAGHTSRPIHHHHAADHDNNGLQSVRSTGSLPSLPEEQTMPPYDASHDHGNGSQSARTKGHRGDTMSSTPSPPLVVPVGVAPLSARHRRMSNSKPVRRQSVSLSIPDGGRTIPVSTAILGQPSSLPSHLLPPQLQQATTTLHP